MKVNKSLLAVLSIFLILLVFVSSASAADSNETQVLSDNDDGIITATNNENNLTMEEGTYKDVVDLIGSGGGDITLERKLYKYDAVSGGSTITISSQTTIDGNGAILDMAGSDFQVFFLDNKATIKNLTIKNAHGTGQGSVAHIYASYCSVENCTFINNTCIEGGVFYLDMGKDTIKNCIFINNTATNQGGAIHIYNDGNTIENCTFINNTADNGGAISCGGFSCRNNVVENCSFVNNKGNQNETFYLQSENNVDIDKNWWGSNNPDFNTLIVGKTTAPTSYAVLNITADPSEIAAGEKSSIVTKFVLNGTNTDVTSSLPKRNVKLTTNGTLTETEGDVGLTSEFSATANGIYYVNAAVDNEIIGVNVKVGGSGPVTGIWYVNSSKTSSGDGKSPDTAFNTLNEALTNSELQDGNTIMIASGEYKGTDNTGLTIDKNLNFNKYGDDDAIFDAESQRQIWKVTATSINITGLTFKNGKADLGGAISIENRLSNSNINATFIGNKAERMGGAIYDRYAVTGNLTGIFINNTASNGGAINCYGLFDNLTGIFINNTASNGGAISIGNTGILGNLNGIFINNKAERNGGAIYIDASDVSGNLTGIFINNEAKNNGGAVYIEISEYYEISGNLTGTYINNTANNGGAIYTGGYGLSDTVIRDSIFINNGNDTFKIGSGRSAAVNCWFGNNATNYNIAPENIGNVIITDWLFLNATANPTEINVGETSEIIFKLDSYNATSNTTGSYDASKMYAILEVSQTLGEVNKNITLIGEEVLYTAKQKGNASVTGKFVTAFYTVNIQNGDEPKDAEIIIDKDTISLNVGESAPTGAHVEPSEAGSLEYQSNDTNIAKIEIDSEGNPIIVGVTDGTAKITVHLNPNPGYKQPEDKYITVNVGDEPTSINVVAENLTKYYGSSEQFIVNVTDNAGKGIANKTASITINGVTYNRTTDENGIAGLNINLNSGNYTAIVTVDSITVNATVTVSSTIDGSDITSQTRNVTYNVWLVDSKGESIENGTIVEFNINGIIYQSPVIDDIASVDLILNSGNYTITATNPKTNEHQSNNIIINAKDITIKAEAEPITAGENATIIVTGFENATGDVGARIDGGLLSTSIVNGTATFTVPGLTSSTTAYIIYEGDENYNPANTTVDITVYPQSDVVIVAENVTKYYHGPERFVANIYDSELNPMVNKSVNITINGVTYTKTTDDNGTVSMAINLGSGTYDVTTKVDNTTLKSTVTVLSTVIGSDLTKYYRNGTQYSVQVYNTNGTAVGKGEVVTFNINGIFYNRTTDENGIATLNINLPQGEYVITAINPVTGEMHANNITVLPILNATDLKMKYLDGNQFKANLVDGQGNPYKDQFVRFNINGKFYDRLTDSNGQAALNIRLPPGEYIITSSFNGCNIANKITITG